MVEKSYGEMSRGHMKMDKNPAALEMHRAPNEKWDRNGY